MHSIYYIGKFEKGSVEQIQAWMLEKYGVENEEYLHFVGENGVGYEPLPCRLDGSIDGYPVLIEEFCNLGTEGTASVSGRTEMFLGNKRISEDQMVFATGGGGHLTFTLVMSGEFAGKVYVFLDGSVINNGKVEDLIGDARVVAGSFKEFINQLYADDYYIEEWQDTAGYLPDGWGGK